MSSQPPELDSLKLRIENLERQARTLKRVLFVVVVAAGALVFMAQANPNPRVVTADDFIVHDGQGREVAELGIDGLILFDSHGHIGLHAKQDPTLGGSLMVWASHTPEVIAVTGKEIELSDEKGKLISFFNRDALALHEENGKMAVQLAVGEGIRGLSVLDESGFSVMVGKLPLQNRATGNGETGSAASITMLNSDGRVIWRAP